MKKANKINSLFYFILVAAAYILLFGQGAIAAEETGNWRSSYDLILMWLNFIIFVFLLYKLAKTPVMDFLTGRKAELVRKIQQIDEEKRKAEAKVEETRKKINESEIRFAKMKERAANRGKKEKQKIIDTARQQSRFMLEEAKRRAEHQITQAKKTFRSELINEAIDLAMKKLPDIMTKKDDQKMVNDYLDSSFLKK